MKKLFLLVLAPLLLFAASIIKPASTIDVDGNVIDSIVVGDLLYVTTDAGTLETYNWKSRKLLNKISYPKIHDFMGDLMLPKVFGVDVDPKTGAIVVQVQAEEGARVLYIYDAKGHRQTLLDEKSHIQMREVRFVDSGHLLISTMSNDLILFDIAKKKILYREQISPSTFSDYQLNEDHTKVASSCESGDLFITDVMSGKRLKTYSGINKDNVFKVDYKNNRVLTCGKDKKAVLYNIDNDRQTVFPTDFFVYAGALNADASMSAFQIDIDNDIALYDNQTKEMKYKLVGASSTLNNIIFIDDKTLISSSDDNHILIWRIP
ncbi:WD40 repeat domain-containing protein [Hydrogenimonas urashimensis]|uniref:WD40 repeat domain-containing protein n=1 Tax=Hydrogenimonas urashimensis TaxID=2740515 RepID=UPI0019165F0C|nr:hypothetical protein [Hydrogenimonas urashimensis]